MSYDSHMVYKLLPKLLLVKELLYGMVRLNSSRCEPILCASLLHGKYIYTLVICQILAELMCFKDVIINLMGGQRQAKCGMSKIACYIDYYKVTSSFGWLC